MVELMAPAGSFESLMAALHAGADSVYLGIDQLNMRARATMNFRLGDIPEIVRRVHDAGKKVYITLNTILYDHDLRLMRQIIDRAREHGIDAVIASDPAVLMYCREVGMPVHISTQCNVSNIESLAFYSAYADVVVLARELTLKQVRAIADEIRRREIRGPSGQLVRIEIFAHGALCMAISGKCYLSLHSHNASANRGACIQNCRRAYHVVDEDGNELRIENEYIMSPKDLCTIDFLDKIVEAGVQVIKIEGRGRSPDYVDVVVRCYREALDAIAEGSYSPERIRHWMERLRTVYNRGFWDGYYLGRKLGEWSNVYGSQATRRKIYLGKGVHYFNKIGVGEFTIHNDRLEVGDKVLITGPTTGVVWTEVDELRVEDKPVRVARKGDLCSFKVPCKIRPSDKLYKIVDASAIS